MLLQEPGVFDTQMYCCASGNVDACGICDGSGDQCGTECSMRMPTPVLRRRQLLEYSDVPADVKEPIADALKYDVADFNMTFQADETDSTQSDVRLTISAAIGSVAQ